MADEGTVSVSENSPEQVALKLLMGIAVKEGKDIFGAGRFPVADKKWMLETYQECLIAVKNPRRQ